MYAKQIVSEKNVLFSRCSPLELYWPNAVQPVRGQTACMMDVTTTKNALPQELFEFLGLSTWAFPSVHKSTAETHPHRNRQPVSWQLKQLGVAGVSKEKRASQQRCPGLSRRQARRGSRWQLLQKPAWHVSSLPPSSSSCGLDTCLPA